MKYDWLEYSLRKNAAFCLPCRIFSLASDYTVRGSAGGGHAGPDPAFTVRGYTYWKNALSAFEKHQHPVAHRHAVAAMKNFMNSKPVDQLIDQEAERRQTARTKLVDQNRATVGRLFSITRLLGRLCLPFRGPDETARSLNRGNFVEFVLYLANHGDEILSHHLKFSPKNAQYLSPSIQNELITLLGEAIRDEIIKRVKNAQFFVIMMDETQDSAHVDQLIIMIRFVLLEGGKAVIEERMVSLVTPGSKTGEALELLLLDKLAELGLNIKNAVGQGYDGGANLAGAYKGVQARILQINHMAMLIHCFAHSLNRA